MLHFLPGEGLHYILFHVQSFLVDKVVQNKLHLDLNTLCILHIEFLESLPMKKKYIMMKN